MSKLVKLNDRASPLRAEIVSFYTKNYERNLTEKSILNQRAKLNKEDGGAISVDRSNSDQKKIKKLV